MKTFVIIALTLALTATTLAGCRGGSTQDNGPQESQNTTPTNTTKGNDNTTLPLPTPGMSHPEQTAGEDGMVPQESGNGQQAPGSQGGSNAPGESGAGANGGQSGGNGSGNPSGGGAGDQSGESRGINRGRFRSRLD